MRHRADRQASSGRGPLPDANHACQEANSPDFELRVHGIVADPGSGVTTVAEGGFGLSDPDRLIPWTTWRDGGCAAAPSLPAGYRCPAPERVLSGWDFDIESFQTARTRPS